MQMPDDRIQQVVHHAVGPKILDLGAVQHDADKESNENWLHRHLVNEFEYVLGVDILAEEVRELNDDGYNIIVADVTQMDIGIVADTVVAGELIEHVDNPGSMLERIYDHLRPGGRLVLTTPNPWAFVHLRRILTSTLSINQEHVAWYGPNVLRQLLDRHGFDVTHMRTTNRDHEGLTGLAQALGSDILGGTTWVCVSERR
jgi:2-polyprenyl-3-methyl-5-hydroxy-6-metoxy-1,4-benzoquinol methylase